MEVNEKMLVCLLSAVLVVGAFIMGSCLRDRQWEPRPLQSVQVGP